MNRGKKLTLLGPVALLAGGVMALTSESETRSWERQKLTEDFLTEGVSLGDLNGDGEADLVAGNVWFAGPDFTQATTYRDAPRWRVKGYAQDSFLSWVADLDRDGWNDILMAGHPGRALTWYRNPGEKSEDPWVASVVMESIATECPGFVDVVGDELCEAVGMVGGRYGYATYDPVSPADAWTFFPVSAQLSKMPYIHGLGVGDLNGDGRADIVANGHWFAQPADLSDDWVTHEFAFSEQKGGAQILVEDWDGDGDHDVVTSLNGHGYGLAWFENTGPAEDGGVQLTKHEILPEVADETGVSGLQFSQLHALERGDFDGDGRLDFVTGKRYWAHSGKDSGAEDPALLVVFLNRDSPEGVRWEAQIVDEDSGVGCQVLVADFDGDGRSEIASGNKKGVFVFR